jgi:hypothetical protein
MEPRHIRNRRKQLSEAMTAAMQIALHSDPAVSQVRRIRPKTVTESKWTSRAAALMLAAAEPA